MENRPASQEAARRAEGLAGSSAGSGAIGDHFAAEGRRARGRFLAACGAAGIPVRSFPMADGATRGKGRSRSVDVARIGSPEADRVLAICPGAKLEDGLCASGVSVACLREHLRREIPRRVAMVFVHRIDPLELAAPDRVQAADDAPPAPQWNDAVLAAAEHRFAAYQQERGSSAMPLRRKRMAKEDPSPALCHAIVREFFAGARRVAILDIGIGNGEYGHGEVASCHPAGSPGEARAGALFGARPAGPDGHPAAGGPLVRALLAHIKVEATAAALEFGTYSMKSVVDLMLVRNAKPEAGATPPRGRLFYPDAADWRQAVWDRSADVIRQGLRGLDSG